METVYIVCYVFMGLGVLLIFVALFRSDKRRDEHDNDDAELPTFAITHKIGGRK